MPSHQNSQTNLQKLYDVEEVMNKLSNITHNISLANEVSRIFKEPKVTP